MPKITHVKFSVEDKVYCGSYESVQPGVEFTVALADGEQPEDVAVEMMERVGNLWEKDLCQRLWTKIQQHQELNGPPLDPWAYRLYEWLRAKHYGDTRG